MFISPKMNPIPITSYSPILPTLGMDMETISRYVGQKTDECAYTGLELLKFELILE